MSHVLSGWVLVGRVQTKSCVFLLNIVLGASEHRSYDFSAVTSQGFQYNVVKEKREADTNCAFPNVSRNAQ